MNISFSFVESPTVKFSASSTAFSSDANIQLSCSAYGGYPLHHSITIIKNGKILSSKIASELNYTIQSNEVRPKYGLYQCVVDTVALKITKEIVLEEEGITLSKTIYSKQFFKVLFRIHALVHSCAEWNVSCERVQMH